jgi:hypothetical protein
MSYTLPVRKTTIYHVIRTCLWRSSFDLVVVGNQTGNYPTFFLPGDIALGDLMEAKATL